MLVPSHEVTTSKGSFDPSLWIGYVIWAETWRNLVAFFWIYNGCLQRTFARNCL